MKQLHIQQLSHKYGLVEVLDNISLSASTGETLALVGPSGCGKSTLLQLIAGLLTPGEGKILQPFARPAFMFQEPRLLPWKNARDNLCLGLKASGMGKKQRHAQAEQLALRLGLHSEDLDKYPHELSGGMQSRISLGRALIIQPDLLLLDEPFSALDIGLKRELYALVREQVARHDSCILMITHDLMEAVRLADRILMMVPRPGRIIGEFAMPQPHSGRNDTWVHQTTAKLLQEPQIQIGFGLREGSLDEFLPGQIARHSGCSA